MKKKIIRKRLINPPFSNDFTVISMARCYVTTKRIKLFSERRRGSSALLWSHYTDKATSSLVVGALTSSMGSSSFRGRMGEPRFSCRKSSLVYPFDYTALVFVFGFVFMTLAYPSGCARRQNFLVSALRAPRLFSLKYFRHLRTFEYIYAMQNTVQIRLISSSK